MQDGTVRGRIFGDQPSLAKLVKNTLVFLIRLWADQVQRGPHIYYKHAQHQAKRPCCLALYNSYRRPQVWACVLETYPAKSPSVRSYRYHHQNLWCRG